MAKDDIGTAGAGTPPLATGPGGCQSLSRAATGREMTGLVPLFKGESRDREKSMIRLGTDPPIGVILRRSARMVRFSLRVSRLDGRVTLSMPAGTSEKRARAFLQAHETWLRQTLAALPETLGTRVAAGARVPLEGRFLRVAPGEGRALAIRDGRIVLPQGAHERGRAGPVVMAHFKALARERVEAAVTRHGAVLGRRHMRLRLADPRSRWGSCTSGGALMFSWRLIMAPPFVLDYTAAHEVAHLAEMSHAPAFWRIVEGLCPDWRRGRAWLREEGERLHHYRFEASVPA